MKLTIGQLRRVIQEVSTSTQKKSGSWAWNEFGQEFPEAAERFEERWAEDGDANDPINGTFQLESPSKTSHVYKADSSAIVMDNKKRRVITYYDDQVAWAYDGYSFGWQSID